MSIIYTESEQTITLETKSSSYQMKIDEHGMLLHTWYGKKLMEEDLSYAIPHVNRGFSGNPH